MLLLLAWALAGLGLVATLMGLSQAGYISYGSVWLNSDLGAAVGQLLLVALVAYLVHDSELLTAEWRGSRNVNAIKPATRQGVK